MKSVLFIGFLFFISILFAQKPNSGVYHSELYKYSDKYAYKDVKQKSIKSVRLAVRCISVVDSVNYYLFYPSKPNGNQIGLFDLMLKLANEGNVKLYQVNTSFFDHQISPKEVYEVVKNSNKYRSQFYEFEQIDTSMTIEYNSSAIKKFYLMESVIIGNENQIIETRPLALCPILNDTLNQFEYSDSIQYSIWEKPLFWIYFPDIMPYLAFHKPEYKAKEYKNTLEFFVKNRYVGELNKYMHFDFDKVDIDVSMEAKGINTEGFDIDWIYNAVELGRYVDAYNKKYRGNVGVNDVAIKKEILQDSVLHVNEIFSARKVYKTIDLRKPQNYPLHFPYAPNYEQKSLIDVLLEGIRNQTFTAYINDETFEPMSIGYLDSLFIYRYPILFIDEYGEYTSDTIVEETILSSKVHKIRLKELEFYDKKGELIQKSIIGLEFFLKIESNSDITEDYSNISVDEAAFKKLFYVSLLDSNVRALLEKQDVYKFNSSDNISHFSFLKNEMFKSDSSYVNPVNVNAALWELNLSPKVDSKAQTKVAKADININDIFCAKSVYHTVDLENFENRCLFQSFTDFKNQKSFIELIIEAIGKNEIIVTYENQPISFEKAKELVSHKQHLEVMDDYGYFSEYDKVIYDPKSNISRYRIHEAQFFNTKGELIFSKVIGISPIKVDVEFLEGDYFEHEYVLFEISLNDIQTQNFLNNQYAYRFSNGDVISYKEVIESQLFYSDTITMPAGVNELLSRCGLISNMRLFDNSDSEVRYSIHSVIKSDSASIVLREIENDSVNYHFFKGNTEHKGMLSFSEFLFKALQNNLLKTYEYNAEGKFEKNIDLKEVNKQIVKIQRYTTFFDIDYNTGLYVFSDSAILNFDYISKFIIKELHVGDEVFVLGVCPVMMYEAEPGLFMESELFWTSFSPKLRADMAKTEVYKEYCEQPRTIWDCFLHNLYRGKIVSEKRITISEAQKFIDELK